MTEPDFDQVQEILLEALERPAGERPDYVARAADGDEALPATGLNSNLPLDCIPLAQSACSTAQFDQRYQNRAVACANTRCDIGAFERQICGPFP